MRNSGVTSVTSLKEVELPRGQLPGFYLVSAFLYRTQLLLCFVIVETTSCVQTDYSSLSGSGNVLLRLRLHPYIPLWIPLLHVRSRSAIGL